MCCEYKARSEAAKRSEVSSKTPNLRALGDAGKCTKKMQITVCCAGSRTVDRVRKTKAEADDHLGKVTHMAGALDAPRSVLHHGQEGLWNAWSRRSESPLQVIHILRGVPSKDDVDLVSILGNHQTSQSACQPGPFQMQNV